MIPQIGVKNLSQGSNKLEGTPPSDLSSRSTKNPPVIRLIAMGILVIVLIFKGMKRFCGKDGYLKKKKEPKLQRDAAKFEKLRIRVENTVEKDKVDLKGHVTDNCKGSVRELNAGGLKQLQPFVLEP